jgi:hypothetical protein
MMEVGTGDSVLDNLQVEDTIERDGRENRVLLATKLELVPTSAFTMQRPRITLFLLFLGLFNGYVARWPPNVPSRCLPETNTTVVPGRSGSGVS